MIRSLYDIREAARRTIGEIIRTRFRSWSAVTAHQGDIEVKTSEGKTLATPPCVYLNTLSGKGYTLLLSTISGSNDAEWMGQIYRFLGLSVGVNSRPLTTISSVTI